MPMQRHLYAASNGSPICCTLLLRAPRVAAWYCCGNSPQFLSSEDRSAQYKPQLDSATGEQGGHLAFEGVPEIFRRSSGY